MYVCITYDIGAPSYAAAVTDVTGCVYRQQRAQIRERSADMGAGVTQGRRLLRNRAIVVPPGV